MKTETTTEAKGVITPKEASANRTQIIWSTRPEKPESTKHAKRKRRRRGLKTRTRARELFVAANALWRIGRTFGQSRGPGVSRLIAYDGSSAEASFARDPPRRRRGLLEANNVPDFQVGVRVRRC